MQGSTHRSLRPRNSSVPSYRPTQTPTSSIAGTGQLAPGSGEGQNILVAASMVTGAEAGVQSSAGVPGIAVPDGLGFVVNATRKW